MKTLPLVLAIIAAALFLAGHTEWAIAVAVIATIYSLVYLNVNAGVKKSVAAIHACIQHVDKVEAARAAFRLERSFYLKLQAVLGDSDPKTKSAAVATQKALQEVYALDKEYLDTFAKSLEIHSGLIDRMGSASDRELTATLSRKLLDLAADDGGLK